MPRDKNTITAEDLADRLGGKRHGKGWRCLCPAHDDHNPSLDITEGEDGKILVKCRAGCEQATVIDELRSRGLWPVCSGGGNGAAAPSRANGDAVLVDVIPASAPVLDIEAMLLGCRAVQRRSGKLVVITREKDGPDIVHDVVDIVRFEVKDRAGRLLYVEVRVLYGYQPDKKRPDKTHRPITLWRRSDGQLEWRAKGYRKPSPLYGLETLDEDPSTLVVIHEGPGKADRGRRLAPQFDHLALMGGSSQVPHTDWSVLKDRPAVTWFDADAPGEKATVQAHELIAAVGARKIGRVTAPAEVPKGWGIDDLTEQDAASNMVEVLISDALDGAKAPGNGDTENRKLDIHAVPGELVPMVGVNASSDREESQKETLADKINAAIADVMHDFNQKYAVVNEAGKAVVYCPKRDEQLKRNIIERIQFEDLRRMYVNRRIPVGVSWNKITIYKDKATVWLEHKDRRQFLGGVVMDPTNKAPTDCWNLWQGFAVDPSPGDWSLMRDHLRDVICGAAAMRCCSPMSWDGLPAWSSSRVSRARWRSSCAARRGLARARWATG